MQHVRDRVEAVVLPAVKVKGKQQQIQIYSVIGVADKTQSFRQASTDPGLR
jgi:hypothetical protein